MPTWMPGPGERGRLLLGVVAAVALVVGIVLGLVVGDRSDLLDPTSTPSARLDQNSVTPGAVEQALLRASTGWDFELPVHNSTARPVDAELVAFAGLTSPFTSAAAKQIAPGAWGSIRFTAPANCDAPAPATISSVELRLRGAGKSVEVTRPLPGEGQALVEYDRAVCQGGSIVGPRELAGVWALDRAYGPDMYLAGSYLMRFSPDGSFVADDEGRLLTGAASVRGRYRIRGELMVITSQNASGCGVGARSTWRTTLDRRGRLTMVYLNGDCPEGDQGDVWVARRLLLDEGLPKAG